MLLPFIFRRIEKQDRLSRVTYLIKLLKARQELNQILQNENQISIDVRNEATNVLERVDIELATPRENDRFGLFVLSAFVESVLFLGAGFTQLSEWYKVFVGKAYESGLFFLEGIFGYPAARIFLLVLCIILAVVLTIKTMPRLSAKFQSYYIVNFALLAIFNILLVIIVVLVGLILALTDPIVPLW